MTDSNEEMIPISLEDFLTGSELLVDVYARLAENKFVCVARAGAKANVKELSAYGKGKLETLYLKAEDYRKYVDHNLAIAEILVEKSRLVNSQKVTLLGKIAGSVESEIGSLGLSREAYVHAKVISDSIMVLVDNRMELSDLLNNFEQASGGLLKSSLAISFVAAMLGRALRWEKKSTIEKLSLGGLLCDVGLKELPPDIVQKPRIQMTYDELSLWETHPFRGMQLLQNLQIVPDDVISVVYEHHENAIGQGFPRRLRDLRLNPLGRVVAVASQFCDLVLVSPTNPAPKSPKEAIAYIAQVMGQPFNKEVFTGLKRLVAGEEDPVSSKQD